MPAGRKGAAADKFAIAAPADDEIVSAFWATPTHLFKFGFYRRHLSLGFLHRFGKRRVKFPDRFNPNLPRPLQSRPDPLPYVQ